VEVVRYGLNRGSTAFFPRRNGAAPSSAAVAPDGSVVRRDTDPSTTYTDGFLDTLAIALFNWKLEGALNSSNGKGGGGAQGASGKQTPLPTVLPPLPPGGFPRLVALADRIAVGRTPSASRQVVLATLLGLIPGVVRSLFKVLIKPAPWVDRMNANITVEAFAWLVGPCEVVPRETDGEMAAVKLRKCRYLEQCGCTASCVNFCKRPTEAFFREAFGVDAHLAPNHEDGTCMMTFGVKPPVPDPAFEQACYAGCSKAAACAVGAGEERAPCHRLGEQ